MVRSLGYASAAALALLADPAAGQAQDWRDLAPLWPGPASFERFEDAGYYDAMVMPADEIAEHLARVYGVPVQGQVQILSEDGVGVAIFHDPDNAVILWPDDDTGLPVPSIEDVFRAGRRTLAVAVLYDGRGWGYIIAHGLRSVDAAPENDFGGFAFEVAEFMTNLDGGPAFVLPRAEAATDAQLGAAGYEVTGDYQLGTDEPVRITRYTTPDQSVIRVTDPRMAMLVGRVAVGE